MKNLSTLVTASSPLFSIITWVYFGIAYAKKGRPSDVPIEVFAVAIPLLYAVTIWISKREILDKQLNENWFLLTGALLGLVLSVFGRFKYNFPVRLFGFTPENAWMVHVVAIILYAVIFRFYILPIMKLTMQKDK